MANQGYIRYSITPGITTDQPTSTPGTVDPGQGWTTQPYLNFNGDYVRQVGVVSSYVRHDIDNNPVGVISSYVRHDINNDPV